MPTDPVTPSTSPYEPPGPGVPVHVARTEYALHSPREIKPGSRLGRYIIDGELGYGGMGVVLSALDVKLGRRAAVKVVRPRARYGLSHCSQRLLREAQALARIDHPNIVSLYDVGEAGGGLYIAMEELHGVSLKAWLGSERHTWREILAVFLQAGRGLAAAHQAGVMHRDFKPHNVHIGHDGRVVVLDFGLALATEARESGPESMAEIILHNRLTDVGIVLGTNGYLAPEQILNGEHGAHSDQFAFCVALFEALFGRRPYPGDNALQTAHAFRQGVVEMPRRTPVPRQIRDAILRGLQIEPGKRWPSMTALLGELERDPHRRVRSISRTAALVVAAWAGAYGVMWAQSALTARATPNECIATGTPKPLTAP